MHDCWQLSTQARQSKSVSLDYADPGPIPPRSCEAWRRRACECPKVRSLLLAMWKFSAKAQIFHRIMREELFEKLEGRSNHRIIMKNRIHLKLAAIMGAYFPVKELRCRTVRLSWSLSVCPCVCPLGVQATVQPSRQLWSPCAGPFGRTSRPTSERLRTGNTTICFPESGKTMNTMRLLVIHS
jgi:hypothetical protein